MIFRSRKQDEFNKVPLWSRLGAPFRFMGHYFSELIEREDSLRSDQSLGARILGVLTFPFRLVWGFLVFMTHAWASSRPGFAFVCAVPAMLCVGLYFIGLLVADFVYNESKVLSTNRAYYAYHLEESKDHPEYAEWFAKRLIEIKPDDAAFKYQLGLALQRSGQPIRALDIIGSIAPEDGPGWSDAHVWLSLYYGGLEESELDTEERAALVEKHLGFAVESNAENRLAHYHLALRTRLKREQVEPESEEHLAYLQLEKDHLRKVVEGELTPLKLQAIPRLLEVRLKLGEEEARQSIRAEINQMMLLAERNPELAGLWAIMVNCAVIAEDYPRAIQIVQAGMRTAKTAKSRFDMRQLGSRVLLKSADKFTDMNDFSQFRSRFNQLCAAVEFNPIDQTVSLKLLEFIQTLPNDSTDADSTDADLPIDGATPTLEINEAWLFESVTAGSPRTAEGVAHALIGLQRISAGKISEGESHWRIAMADKKFEYIYLVINHLIDGAALHRADEFSNVYDMITLAIELFPDQPILYYTRGKYLKRAGRYEEAASDLLHSSEKISNIEIHKLLSDCYGELGNEEKMLEQDREIEKILDAMDEPSRERAEQFLKRSAELIEDTP